MKQSVTTIAVQNSSFCYDFEVSDLHQKPHEVTMSVKNMIFFDVSAQTELKPRCNLFQYKCFCQLTSFMKQY